MMPCELCQPETQPVLYENEQLRVILVDDPDFTGFCRVIWKSHIAEMTELTAEQRAELMHWVYCTELAIRHVMQPDKVNLASLGNVVPHLHWHVIPRFKDDSHFPNPIWGNRCREGQNRQGNLLVQRLQTALLAANQQLSG